ncbi:MAG TPA: hypothetical protein PL037_02150 [Elusimicrobiales bacterium]|nr:hypothetical protein [Elusimicrobiales bacterium]
MKKYPDLYLALFSAVVLCLAGRWAFLGTRSPFPPPDSIREVRRSAVGDAIALSLGLRRLAADVWFIRLMQYYGAPSPESAEAGAGPQEYGAGAYPEFLPMARHILALDPYFTNAALFSAGSLAFNMNRPEEAVAFLEDAMSFAPREWKYATLLSAIGYSKAKDPRKVAETITPLLNEPDCPVMLRQLGAFLNKKAGDYAAAYRIYGDILATSKDPFYVDNARREMEKLAPLLRAPL